jgi:nicotinamidase-related amidase
MPAHGAQRLLQTLKNIVGQARASAVPIIFVRNCGGAEDPDQKGTPGWELHPELGVEAGDLVLDKSTCDTFSSTNLEEELMSRGISRLIVAGLQSEYCVQQTTLGALARGYEVTLIADGHSTYDGDRPASETSAAVNAELGDRVRLVPAAELRLP